MELEIKMEGNKIKKNNLGIEKNLSFKKFKKECLKLFLNNEFHYKKNDNKMYLLLLGNKIYEFNPKENLKIHNFFKNMNEIIESYNFDSNFPNGLNQKETEFFLNNYQEYIVEKSKKEAIKDLYHLKDSNYIEEEKNEKEERFKILWLFMFVPINTLLLILLGALNFNLPIILSLLLCFFNSYTSLFVFRKCFINFRRKKYLKQLMQDFEQKYNQYEEFQKNMFKQENKGGQEIDVFVNTVKKELVKLISLSSNFSEEKKSNYLQKIEKLSNYYFEQLIEIRKNYSLEERNKLEAKLYYDIQNYLYNYEMEIKTALYEEEEIKKILHEQQQINEMVDDVEDDKILLSLDALKPTFEYDNISNFVKKLR